MQKLKVVRHSRAISSLQCMHVLRIAVLLVSVLSWQSKKIKRVVRSSLAAEASDMSYLPGASLLDAHNVGTNDPAVNLYSNEQFLKAPLVSCKSCVFPSHEMSSHFR